MAPTELPPPAPYRQGEKLDFAAVENEILAFWEQEGIFQKSVDQRPADNPYVFYEGPPSANGTPGIHHVMARTIKDLFCRYHTLRGQRVERKAGWDTHGLPIELQVEKELGITKAEIGTRVSVEEYNQRCREAVLRYKDQWDDLTRRMGYWVDQQHPYITYETKYIEAVWMVIKKLWDKDLIYEGFSIQPYSPAAGTALSSHELNQPGAYRAVKDLSLTAMFELTDESRAVMPERLRAPLEPCLPVYLLAWTTTPWTLPANAALAVGPRLRYSVVRTTSPLDKTPCYVVLATPRLEAYFTEGTEHEVVAEVTGEQLAGLQYRPLFDMVRDPIILNGATIINGEPVFELDPEIGSVSASNMFRVWGADYVTDTDGTGLVHTAPTFGADDLQLQRKYGFSYWVAWERTGGQGREIPIVNEKGQYVPGLRFRNPDGTENDLLSGRYIKDYTDDPNYKSVDEDIAAVLRERKLLWSRQKYEHNYPHCWRTDKPVIYYPRTSFFIKASERRKELLAANALINWKPRGTGEGRFGHWLENVEDWNISRTRYWGTPIPIWKTMNGTTIVLDQFPTTNTFRYYINDQNREITLETYYLTDLGVKESINFNAFDILQCFDKYLVNKLDNPYFEKYENQLLGDLHKPGIDRVVFYCKELRESNDGFGLNAVFVRVPDVLDVWLDSGAMPYAQWGYGAGFENPDTGRPRGPFPADFIAEGVDQTRGWFYTLHALGVLLYEQPAFKNVVSNGLVLDKDGNKMSKRLGNTVDPFTTLATYGADPTRWYMVENAPPWENLRFNLEGLQEVQRKFFGTLFNTYQFYALYANVDGYYIDEFNASYPPERPELDRWIVSRVISMQQAVAAHYDDYDPTRAARAIQDFVVEDLSNWYVRLNRRRFWKGELTQDKRHAFETLHFCLLMVAQLMSPIAPFWADWLYRRMTDNIRERAIARATPLRHESVHLGDWAQLEAQWQDPELEARMQRVRLAVSLALSVRKREKVRVRQPLARLLIATDAQSMRRLAQSTDLLMLELNVQAVEYVDPQAGSQVIVKKAKANFKVLGPRLGPQLKALAPQIEALDWQAIAALERGETLTLTLEGEPFSLTQDDVEIRTQDLPGWSVASADGLTVALDLTLTPELVKEGLARELVNRLQNLRKDVGLDVTDTIALEIHLPEPLHQAALSFRGYIAAEVLAVPERMQLTEEPLLPDAASETHQIEIDGQVIEVRLRAVR